MTRIRFDEVARNVAKTVKAGKERPPERAVGLEHLTPGSPRISAWTDSADTGFSRLFRSGQVLFGKRRVYQRKAAVAEFDGVCSGDILVFEHIPDRLDPDLLAYIVRSDRFVAHAEGTSAGSLSPRTNWTALSEFELVLPESHLDQIRAASVLRQATEKVEAVQGARFAAVTMRRSFLAEHFGLRDSTPANWVTTTIGAEFGCSSGATPKRSLHERYFDGGDVPWVKTRDLNEGIVDVTEECVTGAALEETACRLNRSGTVMVAMYGGFRQIGRTGILGIEAATNQAVCCLESLSGSEILPEHALFALQANRSYWRGVAASSRKDPNITKSDVEGFPLQAPRRRESQEELCSTVRAIDDLIAGLDSAVEKSLCAEQALINGFVDGELL